MSFSHNQVCLANIVSTTEIDTERKSNLERRAYLADHTYDPDGFDGANVLPSDLSKTIPQFWELVDFGHFQTAQTMSED